MSTTRKAARQVRGAQGRRLVPSPGRIFSRTAQTCTPMSCTVSAALGEQRKRRAIRP